MKLILNFVSFLIIALFSLLTLKNVNVIQKFENEKRNNIKKATQIIEENERIQGLTLDSFLNEISIKKIYYTNSATIYVYQIEEYDFVYLEED